jgi:hypothetical protein
MLGVGPACFLIVRGEGQGRGKREEGRGNREQGTGKREEGTGKREQGIGRLGAWDYVGL